MKLNYEEFNFCTPLTQEQMDNVTVIFSKTGRIVDWRDECTLWLWLKGKTLDDGQWEEECSQD